MSASLHVPVAVRFKNAEEISALMLKIQAKEGGRVKILSIQYDSEQKDWVVFYLPVRSIDGGVF